MPPTLEIFPLHPSEYAYQVYLTQVHSHIASLIYDLQRFCMKEVFHCIPLHPPDLQSIVSNKSSLDSSSPIRKKSEYPQFMSSLDAQLKNDPKNSHLPYLASQKHLDSDGQSKCDTQHSKNAKNR